MGRGQPPRWPPETGRAASPPPGLEGAGLPGWRRGSQAARLASVPAPLTFLATPSSGEAAALPPRERERERERERVPRPADKQAGGMRPRALLLALACSALSCCCHCSGREELDFKLWMAQYKKQYSPEEEEYHQRFQIFINNKQQIDKHNAGNHTFQMGLNQFSDMTFTEFRKKYLWHEPQNCSATRGNFISSNAGRCPTAIDWRKKGHYVTPVKNQGPCGSCWTFSTTGCLESAIAIATGKLLNLAEQQLVDCAQDFNNHGCSGGLPSQAFEYILYNRGLMGEDTYPYRAKNGTCQFDPQKAVAFVKQVVNITLNDEKSMVEAVGRYNPVSFAFDVTEDFMHYKQGVYSSTQCYKTPDKVNHAVLAVGYGEEDSLPYWIVKNSWGPYWGMDGYFYIERGKNMCGLASCASYPVPLV